MMTSTHLKLLPPQDEMYIRVFLLFDIDAGFVIGNCHHHTRYDMFNRSISKVSSPLFSDCILP